MPEPSHSVDPISSKPTGKDSSTAAVTILLLFVAPNAAALLRSALVLKSQHLVHSRIEKKQRAAASSSETAPYTRTTLPLFARVAAALPRLDHEISYVDVLDLFFEFEHRSSAA